MLLKMQYNSCDIRELTHNRSNSNHITSTEPKDRQTMLALKQQKRKITLLSYDQLSKKNMKLKTLKNYKRKRSGSEKSFSNKPWEVLASPAWVLGSGLQIRPPPADVHFCRPACFSLFIFNISFSL